MKQSISASEQLHAGKGWRYWSFFLSDSATSSSKADHQKLLQQCQCQGGFSLGVMAFISIAYPGGPYWSLTPKNGASVEGGFSLGILAFISIAYPGGLCWSLTPKYGASMSSAFLQEIIVRKSSPCCTSILFLSSGKRLYQYNVFHKIKLKAIYPWLLVTSYKVRWDWI